VKKVTEEKVEVTVKSDKMSEEKVEVTVESDKMPGVYPSIFRYIKPFFKYAKKI